MRLDPKIVNTDQVIDERAEPPLGGQLRVFLPQRPRRGVARIGQRLFPRFFQLLVVAGEVGFGDVDFAAHLQSLEARLDLQRERPHGAHVRRDVVAAHSVAARRSAHQLAVLVEQIDGDSVDLQLRLVFDVLTPQAAPDPGVPLAQLVQRIDVVDGQHRRAMNNGLEFVDRRTAHPLARRIRIEVFRMLRLQLLQPA